MASYNNVWKSKQSRKYVIKLNILDSDLLAVRMECKIISYNLATKATHNFSNFESNLAGTNNANS